MKKELLFPSSDMLFEVLPKLSTRDLLKLKCVSKEWQCLISDRSFIQVQLKNMEPIAGFSTRVGTSGVMRIMTGYFSFNIYSSETREWRRSGEICLCNHNMQKKGCICVLGTIYWLTDGDQILILDPENEISWLIMVPLPTTQFNLAPEMCMGEALGRLHYVLISDHGLQLWVLKDHFTSQWDLAEKLASDYNTGIPWIGTMTYKDNILLMRVAAGIYLYHFETRKIRHLRSLSALAPKPFFSATVVPYTMSLVPLA